MEELVSYAIGCMMGRYSLDEPGLIYATGLRPQPLHHIPGRLRRASGSTTIPPHQVHLEPGMRPTSKTTSPSWPTTSHQGTTSRAARRCATCAIVSSRTICRPTKDLLALLKRQAEGVSVPGLPTSLQRKYTGPDAYRVRYPAAGDDGFPCSEVGGRHCCRHFGGSPQAAGERAGDTGRATSGASNEKLRHYADQRIGLSME